MGDSIESKTDAEIVAGAAYRAAPLTNVVGLQETVEMIRRAKDVSERLHTATVRLTRTLVVLTAVLVGLTVALVYFAAHH